MFDEFRLSASNLREITRAGTLPLPAVELPVARYALLQGLVVGNGCRVVVDSDFGYGLGAAAWGAAVKRLQGAARPPRYIGVGRAADLTRFVFTVLTRRGEYLAWAKHVEVRVGAVSVVLAGLPAGQADLGVAHAYGLWADAAREWDEVARTVRAGGLVLLNRYPSAEPVPADWVRTRRAVGLDGDGCFLARVPAAGEG